MTHKLFYENPYQISFSTKLIKQNKDGKGRYYVVLKETAFYPSGGGQPHDSGTINGINVIDVEEVDGEIHHYLDEPLTDVEKIVGEIDWERRFDHMQQHAGQHLLTAVFEDNFGFKTVSFHLGKEVSTIDLDTQSIPNEKIFKAEAMTNQLILENRPIETKWVDNKEEIANYPLRKNLAVKEKIRLVIIPEIDYNGCGGTHPKSTGEVSVIKILHIEKQKQFVRVHFVCGKRVIKQLQQKQEVIQTLTSQLSAPQDQLNGATDRLLEHTKKLERKIEELTTKLIQYEAKEFLTTATPIKEHLVIRSIFKDRLINDLQNMARELVTRHANLIVIFISEQKDRLQVVCARSEDMEVNMNQLLKAVLPSINGKGGGKASFVQGGGEKLIPSEALMDQLIGAL